MTATATAHRPLVAPGFPPLAGGWGRARGGPVARPRTSPRPGARHVPRSAARPTATTYLVRRLLALALLAGLVVLTVGAVRVVGSSVQAPAARPAAERASIEVVVGPGDSYWSLATRLEIGGDVREVVDALVRANDGRLLHPGDRIQLAR